MKRSSDSVVALVEDAARASSSELVALLRAVAKAARGARPSTYEQWRASELRRGGPGKWFTVARRREPEADGSVSVIFEAEEVPVCLVFERTPSEAVRVAAKLIELDRGEVLVARPSGRLSKAYVTRPREDRLSTADELLDDLPAAGV